jgi:co-chaperonin GroES (HSP10)
MNLNPIRNSIIFKFLDEIDSRGQFVTTTASGIILTSHHEDSARNPRWVEVLAVGPDCEKVVPGDRILLPALRWTKGVKFEEQRMWKTDENEVVAVLTKTNGAKFTFLKTYVGFIRQDSRVNHLASGLTVIGQTPETPSGVVLKIGEDADPVLEGCKIYFDDTNFYNQFELFDTKIWFIKQEDILLYESLTEEE